MENNNTSMSETKTNSDAALTGSLRDYREPRGTDIIERVNPFYEWQDTRKQVGLWPYSKSTDTAPTTSCAVRGEDGLEIVGVNFASQDYLSLSSHPAVKEAANKAIKDFGVHSAGSAALLGNTQLSLKLEDSISEFLEGKEVVLYPTGWSAGFAAVQGFVRPNDHVLLDVLSHSCLQEGARAATQNIYFHGHLNVKSVTRRLARIRANDTENAILVITESLFSMHSDTPDIGALRAACDEYDATLLVDAAHDIGCIGEDGLGHMGLQGMLHQADLIVGSFSKSFASNGGFVAVGTKAAKEYLKYYSATQTFSNALSPIQAAVVLEAVKIIRSEEGRERRVNLMDNILYMRGKMSSMGLEVLGDPSPIVPVKVGAEGQARLASLKLSQLGAIANLVEYPAVPQGGARFRVQVMADHSHADIDILIGKMLQAMEASGCQFQNFKEGLPLGSDQVVKAA